MSETNPVVLMETSLGDITLELNADKAPITVANFLAYAQDGFYDGTIFHRVIENFMIQGGGLSAEMKEKKGGKPIKNEADNGLSNQRGTVAMARTQVVDSATSQFFINTVDNNFLDHSGSSPQAYGYAVFGKVKDGMETVDAIRKVATGNRGPHQDVPSEPVVINRVSVVEP
jgi:peptidyl-prolyl cis-trans isomerase B (cyclophilin B)